MAVIEGLIVIGLKQSSFLASCKAFEPEFNIIWSECIHRIVLSLFPEFSFLFLKFYFIFKLYNIVLVLLNIKMIQLLYTIEVTQISVSFSVWFINNFSLCSFSTFSKLSQTWFKISLMPIYLVGQHGFPKNNFYSDDIYQTKYFFFLCYWKTVVKNRTNVGIPVVMYRCES